ncbi:MAG: transposase [Nitrosomonas sp.]|nr:transposase [Nitrosomonas sp.]
MEAFETIGARIKRLRPTWGQHTSVGRANIPDATLVFDHFHIIKLFNES